MKPIKFQLWNRYILLGHIVLIFLLLSLSFPYVPYKPYDIIPYVYTISLALFVSLYVAFILMGIHMFMQYITKKKWPGAVLSILLSYPIILYLIIDSQILSLYDMHFEWPFIKLLFLKGYTYYNLTLQDFVMILGIFAGILAVYILYYFIFIWLANYTLIYVKKLQLYSKYITYIGIIATVLTFVFTNFLSMRSVYNGSLTYYANGLFIIGYSPIFPQTLENWLKNHSSTATILGFHHPSPIRLKNYQLANSWIYPKHPLMYNTQSSHYNILFIMVDTLAYRFYTQAMPYTQKFAKEHMNYTKNFAVGTYTLPAMFSMFYSLSNNYMQQVKKQSLASPVFWKALKERGYSYSSQFYSLTDLTKFTRQKVIPSIPVKRFQIGEAWENDLKTTNTIVTLLKSKTLTSPFFLFVNFSAVHDANFPMHKEVSSYQARYTPCITGTLHISYKIRKQLYNCEYNAALFDDILIHRIIVTLKSQHLLQNTIVIITGDHGQEIFDHNHKIYGHGVYFNRFQSHVPLIIHWPKHKTQRIDFKTSNYDIIPTLMKHNLGVRNPIKDYSMGRDLLNITKDWNMLPIAIPNKYGVIQNGIVHMFDTQYYYWKNYNWETGKLLSKKQNLTTLQLQKLLRVLNSFAYQNK